MPTETSLPENVLEKILTKLGFSHKPTADFDGLHAVYFAWCRKVPFDNSRKLIHVKRNDPAVLPGDTAIDFFSSWLKHGTGGTCWSGNGALHALLQSLGFSAERAVATMLVAPDLPPNHGSVIVDWQGKHYLLDASIMHSEPLPIPNDENSYLDTYKDKQVWGVKLSLQNGFTNIWWIPLHMPAGLNCRIDKTGTTLEEFQKRHEMTREWSPFNYELHFRIIKDDSVRGVVSYQKMVKAPDGQLQRIELSHDERVSLLVNELSMSEEIAAQIPKDTTTPPPPWSKTAREHAPPHFGES